MGDGQHIWAAAEWVLMMRNWFVREEGDRLILGGGVPEEWFRRGKLRFGPTATPWGPLSVTIDADGDAFRVQWEADWRGAAPRMEVRLAGTAREVEPGQTSVRIPGGPQAATTLEATR
jgi:hypothetical protein